MDWTVFLIYVLAAILSLCLFAIAILFGLLIYIISYKIPEKSEEYLKNIVYGSFAGIVVFILTELKGQSALNWGFWAYTLPINLGGICLFILCGYAYLHFVDKMFRLIERKKQKGALTQIGMASKQKKSKVTLQKYFDKNGGIVSALGIFSAFMVFVSSFQPTENFLAFSGFFITFTLICYLLNDLKTIHNIWFWLVFLGYNLLFIALLLFGINKFPTMTEGKLFTVILALVVGFYGWTIIRLFWKTTKRSLNKKS